MLRVNGFRKYGSRQYIRERSELIQVISYSLGVAKLKMWVSVLPLCCPVTYILTIVNYGIELTGSDGWKAFDEKTIFFAVGVCLVLIDKAVNSFLPKPSYNRK